MKRLTDYFIRSFQFRLLAYLLVVGSVPLVLSFYLFYRQSVDYSDQSLSRDVRSAHTLMVDRIEREMSDMDHLARLAANDSQLNELLSSPEPPGYMIEDRLDQLADKRLPGSQVAICINTDHYHSPCDELATSPNNELPISSDRLFDLVPLVPDHWQSQTGIMLHYPVADARNGNVMEQIIVLYNVTRLFEQFKQADSSIVRETLVNEESSPPAKGTGLPATSGDERTRYPLLQNDRITDELPLTLDGYDMNWTSRLEWKSEYLSRSRQTLQTTLWVLVVLLVVLSFMSSLYFSRFFTRPIHHLRTLMKRAEIGDLKAYWTRSGPVEIGDLGESYNQMLFRIDELFRQVKLEEALKKEKEIEALQYQLNPHFLYNTLNTIKWVAKIHKTPQISEVVSSLVRLLQASLGKKGDFLTIKEEIKLIQDYMEIQAFRYGEQVKMHYEIDSIASLCLVPRMILQPLVENALIHGIEPSGREGAITIKAWIERDLLLCQVEDNGVGMPEQTEEQQPRGVKEKLSGIGLRHIREKIKLYYGQDYKMHVFSRRGEGTTIRLSLPIHRGEENWSE